MGGREGNPNPAFQTFVTGMPILLIEQNSNAALKVANRGYVMENGEIVLQDSAANLLVNEDVKKAYLGGQ